VHEATGAPPSWRGALYDWGPVVCVAAAAQARLGMEHPWPGTDIELAITGLATALPLAWRRSRPLPVAAAVGLALVVQVHLVGGSLHFGSFAAAVIAMYSVARHTADRRTAVAGALALGSGVGIAQGEELAATPSQVIFPLFYFVGTWLLGRAIRTLEERATQLRRLNEALERDRESQARLAVVNERLRLARELHDVLAHTVMLMVVQAEAGEETLPNDPAATRRSLAAVQDAGRRGLDDLRDLVGVLRGPPHHETESLPGLGDLEVLCTQMRDYGLGVQLRRSGDLEGLPPSVQASAYRVVQESLTNVLKHSLAREASVEVSAREGRLGVVISDPGPARETARGRGGHGLAGMRERVALHDGRIAVGAGATGFTVDVDLPIRAMVP
jgi:signal transduction histidine kinase